MIQGQLRQQKRRLKTYIRVLPIFIVIIPIHLLCQIYANSPGVEFLKTISKLRF